MTSPPLPATRNEIVRALRFVAERLGEPLSVADVARVAGMSEFHFHRVFRAEVGEPLGRFVTRRRLEVAALRLAYEPDRSITDVALSSGYSSAQNFTKAFSGFFGCNPSEVREGVTGTTRVSQLRSRYGKDFRPSDLYTLPAVRDPAALRAEAARWNGATRFVDAERIPLACMASHGGYALAHLGPLWDDLVARALQLGLGRDGVDAWGVAHDSPSVTAPELCRYHACVPCPDDVPVAAPLFRGEIPAGRYVVFHYDGPVTGVEDAYRSIFSCWFPSSSVTPTDFTPFDRYVGNAPVDGKVTMEMWVRCEARGRR